MKRENSFVLNRGILQNFSDTGGGCAKNGKNKSEIGGRSRFADVTIPAGNSLAYESPKIMGEYPYQTPYRQKKG